MDRGIGLASTIILARVLMPTDFGVVAMAMGVVALLELFAQFGVGEALIQRRDVDRAHYDTAWTFNVLLGCAIGTALLALAWPASIFYQHPSLVSVLVVLAAAPVIQGLENIGLIAFRRDLNFKADFLITTCKRLILFAITVSLALLLRSYWALVIGIVAGRALGVVLSYFVQSYRPRFSLAARSELFGFSKWVLGTNMLAFALQRCSDVVVGRLLGARALGLYNVGAEIATLPTSELIAPINRAVFPGFAKIAGDRPALRREYFTFIGFIALIGIPAAVGLASVAPIVVALVLGPNWLEAIPIVSIIALAGAVQLLQTTNYAVYLAVGRPSRQVVTLLVQITVLVPAMTYLASSNGIIGATYAFALCWTVSLPVALTLVLREIDGRISEFAREVWRPVVAASAMYVALQYFHPGGESRTTAQLLTALLESVLFGGVVYVAVVLVCWLVAGKPVSSEMTILHQISEISGRVQRIVRRRPRTTVPAVVGLNADRETDKDFL